MKLKVKTLKNGTPINEKQFSQWIKALRSGKYPQGTGQLQSATGYCCLGVACKLFTPNLETNEDTGRITGEMPEDQDNTPAWLKQINADVEKRGMAAIYEGYPTGGSDLVSLNDDFKYSFNDIADCLELIYVHGALKEVEV